MMVKMNSNRPRERIFSLSCRSLRVIIRSVIESLIDTLERENMHTDIPENQVYLALDEAITNAMEHGNRWDGEKEVHINAFREESRLFIEVEDEGDGFDPEGLNIPSDPLRHRGRGIMIMRKICPVRWNEKGNRLTLELRLAD